MPAYTVAQAQTELDKWKLALDAASNGTNFTWQDRSISPPSVEDCLRMITYFEGIVDAGTAPKQKGYALANLSDPS